MKEVAVCAFLLLIHSGVGLVVQTTHGLVSGIEDNGLNMFLGIPFSAPPVGSLRWAPPQPHSAWGGVLNATQMPPACPQTANFIFNITNQSEDCLFLNVYVPSSAPPAGGFPVMVWFFGGGFIFGAISQYDGTFFANYTDVILVIGNYRLGALGFLAHPALSAETAFGTSGNYGFMDQQMILQWVNENIAAFGGNTNSITIFGESAGGISVCLHLLSPLSKGLFSKAIIQSGPCLTTPSLEWGYSMGEQFQNSVGCNIFTNYSDVVSCMRNLSVSTVLDGLPIPGCDVPPAMVWWPIKDGVVLPTEDTLTLVQQKQYAQVPLLLGSNLNEGTIFVYPCFNGTISEANYIQIISEGYGTWGQQLLDLYPFENYINGQAAMSDVVGDGFFTCQVVNFEEALVSAGASLFSYIYTHTPSFVPPYMGALHGAEIVLEFYEVQQIPITQGENQLAFFLMNAFTSFAKSGNPNYNSLLEPWEDFASSGRRLVIDVEISSSSIYKQTQCQFWAQTYQNATFFVAQL